MHEPSPGMRVGTALQRARRLHGRCAQCWRQAKQERHAQRQRQPETQHAPVRRERQAQRRVQRTLHSEDQRHGPPGEDRAGRGRQEAQPGAFHQDQLHQAPAPRSDRYAQRHFARPRCRLRGHQVGDVGARDHQNQCHEHPQSHQRLTVVLLHGGEARGRRL